MDQQNKPAKAVSQLSRRARTQQLAQDQAQVERADMNQVPLQDVVSSAQVAAPHPTRLVAMREAALDELAAPPQQTLAVLAPHPPSVGIHRLLLSLLARPIPIPLRLLLRNVAANLVFQCYGDH